MSQGMEDSLYFQKMGSTMKQAEDMPQRHNTELWFGRTAEVAAGEEFPKTSEYAHHFQANAKSGVAEAQASSIPKQHACKRLK